MSTEDDELERIVGVASAYAQVDFGAYKVATLYRRIRFRVAGLGLPTVAAYRLFLETEPGEPARLVNALLVKTTWMFRDEPTYSALINDVLPRLFASRRGDGVKAIRAWVPACSTGDEAYSLAMCMAEAATTDKLDHVVLASDVDRAALEHVARAIYPRTAVADVPPALHARWLEDVDATHVCVRQPLRGSVTAAYHDLLGARYPVPPEAVLGSFDIISCRNFLIYLRRPAQLLVINRLLKTATTGGVLILGQAESIPPEFNSDVVRVRADLPLYWVNGAAPAQQTGTAGATQAGPTTSAIVRNSSCRATGLLM